MIVSRMPKFDVHILTHVARSDLTVSISSANVYTGGEFQLLAKHVVAIVHRIAIDERYSLRRYDVYLGKSSGGDGSNLLHRWEDARDGTKHHTHAILLGRTNTVVVATVFEQAAIRLVRILGKHHGFCVKNVALWPSPNRGSDPGLLYMTFKRVRTLGPIGRELLPSEIDRSTLGFPEWERKGTQFALKKANDLDYVVGANLDWWEADDYEYAEPWDPFA